MCFGLVYKDQARKIDFYGAQLVRARSSSSEFDCNVMYVHEAIRKLDEVKIGLDRLLAPSPSHVEYNSAKSSPLSLMIPKLLVNSDNSGATSKKNYFGKRTGGAPPSSAGSARNLTVASAESRPILDAGVEQPPSSSAHGNERPSSQPLSTPRSDYWRWPEKRKPGSHHTTRAACKSGQSTISRHVRAFHR